MKLDKGKHGSTKTANQGPRVRCYFAADGNFQYWDLKHPSSHPYFDPGPGISTFYQIYVLFSLQTKLCALNFRSFTNPLLYRQNLIITIQIV